MGKRQDNLLAKIANLTGKSVDDIKEMAGPLYSEADSIYEAQAVLNFFQARVRPTPKPKETQAQFEARYNEWRFATCKECNLEFAYAFTYSGVAYCSLTCLDEALKKIGLRVTRGRDLRKRWGTYHPAIVPSDALAVLRSSHDSSGLYDVPLESALPKHHTQDQSQESA